MGDVIPFSRARIRPGKTLVIDRAAAGFTITLEPAETAAERALICTFDAGWRAQAHALRLHEQFPALYAHVENRVVGGPA